MPNQPTGPRSGSTPRFSKGGSFPKRSSSSRPWQGGSSRFSSTGGKPAFSRGGSAPYRGGGGKPSFSSRGGGNKRSQGNGGTRLDYSKFVNKAVITESVEKFVPEHRFIDFAIEDALKANIVKKGYIDPTPIQDRSIPHVLRGSDLVGIANTGTGKTAAFLIPLINKILKDRTQQILVMVPTRELAVQIAEELQGFTPGLRIFSATCVGGAAIGPQLAALRRGPNFVIGTPGRLKDMLERKALVLTNFGTVVLDEADRMLDMGFINDMRTIMKMLLPERQTLFFSATLSSEIEKLIHEFLKEPVRISVKTGDTSKDVDQDIVRVPLGGSKIDLLHDLLVQPDFNKVLIFGRTKHGVEKLAKVLGDRGFKSESIHGNKTQSRRQKALSLFKEGRVQVLVATDVAARGLDIADVSHVINYDLPASQEDYVHRIGRTGRAGKKGKALTFIEGR